MAIRPNPVPEWPSVGQISTLHRHNTSVPGLLTKWIPRHDVCRQDRSAGFQTCCIADFQSAARPRPARAFGLVAPAGWKPCDTADWETCATSLSMAAVVPLAVAFSSGFVLNSPPHE